MAEKQQLFCQSYLPSIIFLFLLCHPHLLLLLVRITTTLKKKKYSQPIGVYGQLSSCDAEAALSQFEPLILLSASSSLLLISFQLCVFSSPLPPSHYLHFKVFQVPEEDGGWRMEEGGWREWERVEGWGGLGEDGE